MGLILFDSAGTFEQNNQTIRTREPVRLRHANTKFWGKKTIEPFLSG